jgi:hypothetical protein
VYNIGAATAAVRASGMPDADAYAAEYIASSAGREATATLFESRVPSAG